MVNTTDNMKQLKKNVQTNPKENKQGETETLKIQGIIKK